MAGSSSNEAILQQLRQGIANFELTSSPVTSISSQLSGITTPFSSLTNVTYKFFARIGRVENAGLPASKKVERYSVQKVTGDGRCMFRALVKGMALNKGMPLGPREETESADELRMAVKEVICDNEKERLQYQEALVAITVEDSLGHYCRRIEKSDFWGGEAELLVLSKLCCQPIVVYIPEHEHGGWGSGFIPIQEYGSEFRKILKEEKPRKVVRLLYTGSNHYDLLGRDGKMPPYPMRKPVSVLDPIDNPRFDDVIEMNLSPPPRSRSVPPMFISNKL